MFEINYLPSPESGEWKASENWSGAKVTII